MLNIVFYSAASTQCIYFSSTRESYGDNAIGYVQIKRDGELCIVKSQQLQSTVQLQMLFGKRKMALFCIAHPNFEESNFIKNHLFYYYKKLHKKVDGFFFLNNLNEK